MVPACAADCRATERSKESDRKAHSNIPTTIKVTDAGVLVRDPSGHMERLPPGKYEQNVRHPPGH